MRDSMGGERMEMAAIEKGSAAASNARAARTNR